ncbi:MAG: ankyrin repeat domain-containing protein [Armatimonadetes bacterium]|nr:ankyrin repeat domain-containing protein [Armatimonadota bacterium]
MRFKRTFRLWLILATLLGLTWLGYGWRRSLDPALLNAVEIDPTRVPVLLALGADPNIHRQDGTPALMIAARNGDTAGVEALLKHGADVNAQGPGGRTALMEAAAPWFTNPTTGSTLFWQWSEYPRIVSMLLVKGARLNTRDARGYIAWTLAAERGQLRAMSILLNHGADVNEQDPRGWTALMWAASSGWPDLVRLLLAQGANPNLRAKDGTTAFSLAEQPGIFPNEKWRHPIIVRLLRQAGARVRRQKATASVR